MPALRNIAIRWYRKAFGAPAGSDIREQGLDTVLDGNGAVALAEAAIASHAVLGGSAPADGADAVWRGELAQRGTNLFGEPISADEADGPRGIVAAATGLGLTGRRATAFLSGGDLAAAQDLLFSAAGKHVPLVLHVATRSVPAHGGALGSGHDAVHLSADAGFFMLFATNVQEAADFTIIARRVAEETLVPGMVIMDGEQTALAAQDVRLLSPAQVNGLIGSSRELIETPTPAQAMLFGETRRRVPAWHDLDEPVLTGALFDRGSFALGAVARRPFFDEFVDKSLSTAFELFERKTGRRYDPVSRYRIDDAKVVLLAAGAAVETARVAADVLRKRHKVRAGVLGIHGLRPFPHAEIAGALEGCERVFVLDRVDAPLAGEPPLAREVRAGLARRAAGRSPPCTPVVYGLGGLPLRVEDLVALGLDANSDAETPLFLGLAFDETSGDQPKRDVLLDALRRAYPGLARLGIRAAPGSARTDAQDTLTIAIRVDGSATGRNVPEAAAALLHSMEGGRLRSRPAVSWQAGTGDGTYWLVRGDESLQDPGDALAADVTLDVSSGRVAIGDAKVFHIAAEGEPETRGELLLGGLFGVLAGEGLIEARARRAISARRSLLEGTDADHIEERVSAFQAGLEQVAEVDGEAAAAEHASRWEGRVPDAVRHLGRGDDGVASLPRFWDQIGVLYRDGTADRLTPDPYLATGSMPPLSSTFSDMSVSRRTLPVFDPTSCTGCGKCWTYCPDSAIGAVAASPAALIDAAIRRTGAEPVRQVASKLASRMIASNRKAEAPLPTFGQMLEESFGWLMDKAPLPDERKQAIQAGIERIIAEFGGLPVAVTGPFFHDAEARKKDGAELLSLAINPDACKSCGICITSCEPLALSEREQDEAALAQARALWTTWTTTPDTASETLERVADDPVIGTTASLLLSRYCQFALAGGDPAEAGSGEKIAVRLALAATEFHQQPLVQRFASKLAEAGEEVAALIKETLSSTLAVEDLDAVMDQLKTTKSPRVDLRALAEGAGAQAGEHSVDTRYVLRLIELSNEIGTAHHQLVEGEHGLGRARYGLAVAGGSTATWAGAFPHNPFQAPVVIDMTGDAAQIAAGLIEGHLDETTELARLMRLARLEVDRPDGLDWKREALRGLRWKDLGEEEYALCPPLLLVGSDEMLAGRGLSQLIWLLNSGLPVKVIVLSSLDFGLVDGATNNPRGNLGLLAIAQRNAYVAQTSVSRANHLGDSLLRALAFDGPALVQVYAPSPGRHGFASDRSLAQAELAVASRTLPLFRYDPGAAGVFGARISLEGNPGPDAELVATDNGEAPRTFADWARGQQRFASNFSPLASDASSPVAMHEWLRLDTKARRGKTPFIAVPDGESVRQYGVGAAMAGVAAQCLQGWQTLQELAGIVTPFTARVEQEIRAAVAAEHKAELDAQRKASDAEIREIQKKTQAEIAKTIRSRLLELASQKRDG